MKVLAVETVTSWQSVAILDDTCVLAREDHTAGAGHGMLLLPSIHRVLAQAGLKLTELDGLACSVGPGSFTGIRVGIATCLGLRAAVGLPLVLVPTLEAMAWSMNVTACAICPTVAGRTGELYWAIFRRSEDGRLSRILDEHAGPPEAMARSLTGDTVVVGEGWSAMEEKIREALPSGITVFPGPEECAKPSAVAVALLGMHRLRRGEVLHDQVMPLYVRRAEAEINYELSGGVSSAARRQARVARHRSLKEGRKGNGPAGRFRNSNGL